MVLELPLILEEFDGLLELELVVELVVEVKELVLVVDVSEELFDESVVELTAEVDPESVEESFVFCAGGESPAVIPKTLPKSET